MPLDTSIYNQVGRVNLASGLSDILNQQRQREMQRTQQEQTLAQLAQQKELRGYQLRDLQRKEEAIPQQQAHARSAELNNWLSGAVQSGRPIEEVMQEAIAKGQEIGVNPDITQRHVQSVYQSAKDPQARSDYAFKQAYPELVAKQRAAAMFPKKSGVGDQRGVVVYDEQGGGTYVVNPYTSEAMPVKYGDKQIRGAQYSPELQGRISGSKSFGSETGKSKGEAVTKLQDIESMMPRLEGLVTELSDLGKKATYTKAGIASDATRRQLGMKVGEGATARKEYISKVDNEILPLLRQTFGAQFTENEGKALRVTLGDPDASPEEKDAVLRSFLQTKQEQVKSLRRRTNAPASTTQANNQDAEAIQWAQSNPNDPRAAKILQLHGM